MLLRKPLPLWISVSLFVVGVTMIPLSGQLWRRSVSPPRTLTELTTRLSQCTPLHVVPLLPNQPEGPVWVCTRTQSREYLLELIRTPQRVKAAPWDGIVYCEHVSKAWVIDLEDELIHDVWGEYGMRIGPLAFFGDPVVLQRIQEAMLDGKIID